MKVSESMLRSQVDDATWQRGAAYFEEGRVREIVQDGDTVVASVKGRAPYRVQLTNNGDRLFARCSCPVGRRGEFCKHCVAVGLAVLAPDEVSAGSRDPFKGMDRLEQEVERIRAHLTGWDRSALVDRIVEQALEDDAAFERLRIEALTSSDALDRKAVRSAITAATRTRGFIDYRHAGPFAKGIEQVVSGLAVLLKRGFAEDAIPLIEYALRRAERAIEHMDDSDGYMRPILDDLQTLHHAACVEAKPNPAKLARHLFEWAMTGDWEVFLDAAKTYADVFGKEGLAEYRRLAEAAWAKIPALGPGDDRYADTSDRFRITYVMESLAVQSGNLDALIDVKRRDLSSAYQFLRIAELCNEGGRAGQALDWAERGLTAFPEQTDSRLLAFLADVYRQTGREDDATRMIWQTFADHPGKLETYKRLKVQAERTGDWTTWRERAMDRLREDRHSGRDPRYRGDWRAGPVGWHSNLIAVLLWENDIDAAWAEAAAIGCSIGQWIELARRRESEHPDDAVRIYQDYVAACVQQTNNAAYAEATEFVLRIQELMHAAGDEDAFAEYLEVLRRRFKAKRNFMKLLDGL